MRTALVDNCSQSSSSGNALHRVGALENELGNLGGISIHGTMLPNFFLCICTYRRHTPHASSAVQGLCAPKVRLERLERTKAARGAAAAEAALPRLVRLIDFLHAGALVAALGRNLAALQALLDGGSAIRVAAGFRDGGLGVEPPEAALSLAVSKQVCLALLQC